MASIKAINKTKTTITNNKKTVIPGKLDFIKEEIKGRFSIKAQFNSYCGTTDHVASNPSAAAAVPVTNKMYIWLIALHSYGFPTIIPFSYTAFPVYTYAAFAIEQKILKRIWKFTKDASIRAVR